MRIPNPKSSVNWMLEKAGYRLAKLETKNTPLHFDMDREFEEIFQVTKRYTMNSMPNMYALYKAIDYVAKCGVPGDFVECGVWKGGSAMIAAFTLIAMGDTSRHLWLYDTYAGMSEPTDEDRQGASESPARASWDNWQRGEINLWNLAPLEEAKKNVCSTPYPQDKINFIKGKVEDTIPDSIPDEIAVLHLDTDFYESTLHELTHLFPRLSPNGVLIIDDYGMWTGSRHATDQYIAENDIQLLLNRVDASSRIAVKTGRA